MPSSNTWKNRILPCLLHALWIVLLTAGCTQPAPQAVITDRITIAEIQGAGHRSPFENQQVENVHGIVTLVRGDGFYMQSPKPGGDPAASGGIFVYTYLVPSVRAGDEVLVNAAVEEVLPDDVYSDSLTVTQLSYPQVQVLSRRNPLPEPVIIGIGGRIPPTELIARQVNSRVSDDDHFDADLYGLDFYESLEGMLVQVNQAVVVGATNQYMEIVILPDKGSWAGVRTERGGIVVREDDFNPERIILDDGLRQLPFVQVGDLAAHPIIGVIDYAFGNYRLIPVEPVTFDPGGLLPSEPLTDLQPGHLRVASYNIENVSAVNPGQIALLAEHIVHVLRSPDIIALQEVMDNDGTEGTMTVSADQTYLGIIEAISYEGGPIYAYLDIDPLPGEDGGIPGGNIRVGYLYRLDTGLTLMDAPQGDASTAVEVMFRDGQPFLTLNPGRIDPTNPAFINSRKPLVAGFLYQDQPLILINNHFVSKRGDSPLFGDLQPPILYSQPKRNAQAAIVHDFVDSILSANPGSRVIVLGDLNDFHFSEPVQTVQGQWLVNLVDSLPVENRYTYIYQGNSQVLDHILVSASLADRVASFDILRLNTEFDILRRFSDHDPLVVTFDFR